MHIRPYTPADHQAWDEYVESHPGGTIFHTRSWQDAVAGSFGHREMSLVAASAVNGAERIGGILPLFLISSRIFGRFLVSVPFAELGGPLSGSQKIALDLTRAAGELTRKQGLDYLELRNKESLPDLPVKELYYGFQREILPELDDNLKAIPRKSRRMVRQGIKNQLQASTGHHLLPRFYHLLARNFRLLGTPVFSCAWFEHLLNSFGNKALVMLVQDREGMDIAGVLSFFYRDRVLPYYAGSLIEYRNLAPNDFMYWKLMEYAWENGYKVFDFGRSKQDTGSYSFKTHWGFEPRPLFYQYLLHKKQEIPNISPTNPKYKMQIKIWRRIPLSLTRFIGPRISKYLC